MESYPIFTILALLCLCIINFFVYPKELHTFIDANHLLGTYQLYVDYFLWWKGLVSIVLGVILFIGIILNPSQNNFHKDKFNYLLLFLIGINLIFSVVFSMNQKISFYGYFSSNQGLLLNLSYLIIYGFFSYASRLNKIFEVGITIILISNLLIALCQIAGYSYFNFGSGMVAATFGNSNYLGSYFALFFPWTFVLYFSTNKIHLKLIIGMISALTLYVGIACLSRAGYFGSTIAVIICCALLYKKILNQWKYSVLLIVIYLLSVFFQKKTLIKSNDTTFEEIKNPFYSNNKEDRYYFRTVKNKLIYKHNNYGIIVLYDHDKYYFYNTNLNTEIDFSKNKIFSIKEYYQEGYHIVKLTDMKTERRYELVVENGVMKVIHPSLNTFFQSYPAKTAFSTRYDALFSSRVYIWNRTIPLILQHPLVGHGLQTFALEFPNTDIEGRFNADLNNIEIFDRAHSTYLQYLFDFGFIGFFLYCIFFSSNIYSSFLSLLKGKNKDSFFVSKNNDWGYCLAYLAGTIGYLFAAFFNDSWNGVTIYLWIFLGLTKAYARSS